MTRKRTAEELIRSAVEMTPQFERQERRQAQKERKAVSRREKKQIGVLVRQELKRRKSLKRGTKQRYQATKKLLGAFGVIPGAGQVTGPGRPRGTFKYGMPIQKWKELQRRKKVLYSQYKQEEAMQLRRRGLTPQQIQELQVQRTVQPPPQQAQPQQPPSVADDELAFRKWMAATQVSPNTQRILDNLRRTQLKAQRDDVEQQRRHQERRMVASAGSLLATPYIFNRHQLNLTDVSGDNILMAPNVFKENPDGSGNILRPNRLNIMQTREAGNNLKFF